MRIPCPYCGERDLSEFVYYGDTARRPTPTGAEALREFFEAVYLRDNPAGRHEELWYHVQGCRGWLRVTRDTRTHDVLRASLAGGDAA
jgi:heterotetrameric sarcosine oxidase delta subunit